MDGQHKLSLRGRQPVATVAGYTAVELVATMSVMALVTALAVPGMRSFLQNNRAANEANALVGALALARNETITRGVPVTVCASTDGATCTGAENWADGWIVFTDANAPTGSVDEGDPDDTVLRIYPGLGEGSTLTAAVAAIPYAPTGFLAAGVAADFSLEVPDCTGNHARTINVSLQGRTAVAPVACDGEGGE